MKLLFFSPFSGIWEFASLEGRVAAALATEGHEVAFVTCGGLFRRHCLVMAAHGLAPDANDERRDRVCRDCVLHADALCDELALRRIDLVDVLGERDRADIQRLMSGLKPEVALALEMDGIPVGRRALYPFLALKKKDRMDLSDAEWAEYQDQLHNTVLAVRATRTLIERFRPDAVVTYSSTYSIVAACLEVARLKGVKEYFLEASGGMGSRHYRGILARGGIAAWYGALRRIWEHAEDEPADPGDMRLVTDHMLHLFGARSVFVYSASAQAGSFDVRGTLGARAEQRILLATMSSYDEWFAAEQAGLMPVHASAFESQIEWIETLFEILARRPELFLVLRVHPREFPNKREGAYSAHSQRLLAVLKDKPANCRVNWPDENLSLYDLAKDVDVVLNAWSSAGKEMTLLGLPVVEWAPEVLLYPPDPRYVARQATEYEACIDRALTDGWRAERIRRMYRWCALEYGAATFNTAPPLTHQAPGVRLSRRVLQAIHRRLSPIGADRVILRRQRLSEAVAKQLAETIATGASTLAESRGVATGPQLETETHALAKEVERLAFGLFGFAEGPGGGLKEALVQLARAGGRSALRQREAA
jgi:hypothetical protein